MKPKQNLERKDSNSKNIWVRKGLESLFSGGFIIHTETVT